MKIKDMSRVRVESPRASFGSELSQLDETSQVNESYGDSLFWTPVNFEVEHFLNEETEGVFTDTYCDIFLRPAPNLAISTQT